MGRIVMESSSITVEAGRITGEDIKVSGLY
jgi:hypothetical protein